MSTGPPLPLVTRRCPSLPCATDLHGGLPRCLRRGVPWDEAAVVPRPCEAQNRPEGRTRHEGCARCSSDAGSRVGRQGRSRRTQQAAGTQISLDPTRLRLALGALPPSSGDNDGVVGSWTPDRGRCRPTRSVPSRRCGHRSLRVKGQRTWAPLSIPNGSALSAGDPTGGTESLQVEISSRCQLQPADGSSALHRVDVPGLDRGRRGGRARQHRCHRRHPHGHVELRRHRLERGGRFG